MGALLCGLVSYDTLGVYRKNQGVSEKQTIWQSVFYGALMIADDPDAAMEELGIPVEMKADIGKHAYYPNSEYVYPIESDELQEKFYDRVTTMTLVRYYLRHPKDMLTMMNRAAQESVTLSTSFMTYTDALYSDNRPLHRMNLWCNLRSIFAARAFWVYVLLYGTAGVLPDADLPQKDAEADKAAGDAVPVRDVRRRNAISAVGHRQRLCGQQQTNVYLYALPRPACCGGRRGACAAADSGAAHGGKCNQGGSRP